MTAAQPKRGRNDGVFTSQTGETLAHVPVMLSECLDALRIKAGGVYCDCTLGCGGHSDAILARLDTGTLVCLDRDPEAVRLYKERFSGAKKVVVLNRNFSEISDIWAEMSFQAPDGVLMDLGFSSAQISAADRGLSFADEASLDMRLNPEEDVPTAADLVNNLTERELSEMFFRFGERSGARRIARRIAAERRKEPIQTAKRLAEIAAAAGGRPGKTHPATRIFLALRATVNRELEALEKGLRAALNLLNPSGRAAVISYHSLEDGIVKNIFRKAQKGCRCSLPPDECRCGFDPLGRILIPGGLVPTREEIGGNPRARSARLRIFERGS